MIAAVLSLLLFQCLLLIWIYTYQNDVTKASQQLRHKELDVRGTVLASTFHITFIYKKQKPKMLNYLMLILNLFLSASKYLDSCRNNRNEFEKSLVSNKTLISSITTFRKSRVRGGSGDVFMSCLFFL